MSEEADQKAAIAILDHFAGLTSAEYNQLYFLVQTYPSTSHTIAAHGESWNKEDFRLLIGVSFFVFQGLFSPSPLYDRS